MSSVHGVKPMRLISFSVRLPARKRSTYSASWASKRCSRLMGLGYADPDGCFYISRFFAHRDERSEAFHHTDILVRRKASVWMNAIGVERAALHRKVAVAQGFTLCCFQPFPFDIVVIRHFALHRTSLSCCHLGAFLERCPIHQSVHLEQRFEAWLGNRTKRKPREWREDR